MTSTLVSIDIDHPEQEGMMMNGKRRRILNVVSIGLGLVAGFVGHRMSQAQFPTEQTYAKTWCSSQGNCWAAANGSCAGSAHGNNDTCFYCLTPRSFSVCYWTWTTNCTQFDWTNAGFGFDCGGKVYGTCQSNTGPCKPWITSGNGTTPCQRLTCQGTVEE